MSNREELQLVMQRYYEHVRERQSFTSNKVKNTTQGVKATEPNHQKTE